MTKLSNTERYAVADVLNPYPEKELKIEPKEYGMGFKVDKSLLVRPKEYGYRILKNGRKITVNYHRELKNGKGFDFFTLMEHVRARTLAKMIFDGANLLADLKKNQGMFA